MKLFRKGRLQKQTNSNSKMIYTTLISLKNLCSESTRPISKMCSNFFKFIQQKLSIGKNTLLKLKIFKIHGLSKESRSHQNRNRNTILNFLNKRVKNLKAFTKYIKIYFRKQK